MFWQRNQPPTPGQRLSQYVQRAAYDQEIEREKLDLILATFVGIQNYASECESEALQKGSSAALAFRQIGQATQVLSIGTTRAIAALPQASLASLKSLLQMAGAPAEEVTTESV